MEPEQLCKNGTEDGHQAALFCWAQKAIKTGCYPIGLEHMFAIPNGGSRHIAEATKLRATGVKAGIPDIMLPVPRGYWHGMFLEMKRPASVGKSAGVLSLEQTERMKALIGLGYYCSVAWTWMQGRDAIETYLRINK